MIYDISPVNNYRGNNNSTIFDFDFYIDNENQLKVYLYDENNVKFELKNNVDYLIEGVQNENGGYITFPIEGSEYAILNDSQKISLELDLPVSQETQYNNSSLLNLEALEYSFDYLTRLIQILKRKIALCVKVEECSQNSPQELIDMINDASVSAQLNANQVNVLKNQVFELSELNSDKYNEIVKIACSIDDFKDELISNGMYKFNLFDTKISDHILEGREAKGWALQGTYVTKESYPDFYNKCLEEYQNSTEEVIGFETWVQPKATANTTSVDGGNMVISASSEYTGSGEYAWKAMDGNTTSTHFSLSSTNTGWWQVKFPYKLLIKGLTYYSRARASTYPIETATFYTSSDMTQQIGDTFSAPTTDYTAFEVQNIPQEGIVTDTIYLTMNGSGSTCGMGELVINAQKLTSDIYYTIYKNNNGHKFYSIAGKSAIDEIYNQYGIADFYGIDEENERIFLPRNKYFQQLTDDISKVNEMVEAGLPDIKGTIGGLAQNGREVSGAFYNLVGTTAQGYGSTAVANYKASFSASKSSAVYGNSETIQPPSSLKLLYYCVGNIVINDAEIDAGALVSQVELKANISLDNINQQAKNLMSRMAMPSNKYIDLTLGASGTTYIAPANGYFYLDKVAGSDWYYSSMKNEMSGVDLFVDAYRTSPLTCIIPAKKSENVFVHYNATGETNCFRFIYAEGEQ